MYSMFRIRFRTAIFQFFTYSMYLTSIFYHFKQNFKFFKLIFLKETLEIQEVFNVFKGFYTYSKYLTEIICKIRILSILNKRSEYS